jgi:hypothetical protein
MAPKRKQPGAESHATTYWLDAIRNMTHGDHEARDNSFHDLIMSAHRWGEAMVQSELTFMESRGISAVQRQKCFNSMGQTWYTRGYRYWLAPHSSDAPEAIRASEAPNRRIAAQTLDSLRHEAQRAGREWWSKYASDVALRMARAVDAEASAVAKGQSPAKRASPAISSPRTVIAPKPPPPGPELPQPLRRLLSNPGAMVSSNPHPSIREWVKNAFHDARIMRAWSAAADGKASLSFLGMEAHTLELNLHASKLEYVYGDGDDQRGPDALRAHGLARIAGGGFNTIWGCKSAHRTLRAAFPDEVWGPFVAGELVLRVPKITADWLTLEQAVGEASNMLLTALCDCGPRVAALSFARKLFRDPDAKEEGVCVVKYKIFTFLECAKQGVDARYAADTLASSSATSNRAYYNALLVAVYQYSYEGFVHLDATLRNFVDFYDKALPRAPSRWAVKAIDVEDKHFRRLCPEATTEWRNLLLFNLMIVLVFLKVALAGRWDVDVHWRRVRTLCIELRTELENKGKGTLPAIAMWEGVFDLNEGFPDMTLPPYAGDAHQATAFAAMRQMRYYLLEQPIEEATKHYVDVLKDPKADHAALRKAQAWHDGHYRSNVVPAHRFFLHSLAPPGSARRFVDVAFEFLDTSHVNLQLQCFPKVPLSSAHNRSDSREYLLRIII